MYFDSCKTFDDAKSLFRKLSMKFHPDHGGDQADFVRMYKEFEDFVTGVEDNKKKDFKTDSFYNACRAFDGLENIRVEVMGTFFWLTDIAPGATYAQKEAIKSIHIDGYNNARFARKKKAWYFSPVDYKRKSGKYFSLNDVRALHGSKEYQPDNSQRKLS